jgi:hypothetical protein
MNALYFLGGSAEVFMGSPEPDTRGGHSAHGQYNG